MNQMYKWFIKYGKEDPIEVLEELDQRFMQTPWGGWHYRVNTIVDILRDKPLDKNLQFPIDRVIGYLDLHLNFLLAQSDEMLPHRLTDDELRKIRDETEYQTFSWCVKRPFVFYSSDSNDPRLSRDRPISILALSKPFTNCMSAAVYFVGKTEKLLSPWESNQLFKEYMNRSDVIKADSPQSGDLLIFPPYNKLGDPDRVVDHVDLVFVHEGELFTISDHIPGEQISGEKRGGLDLDEYEKERGVYFLRKNLAEESL